MEKQFLKISELKKNTIYYCLGINKFQKLSLHFGVWQWPSYNRIWKIGILGLSGIHSVLTIKTVNVILHFKPEKFSTIHNVCLRPEINKIKGRFGSVTAFSGCCQIITIIIIWEFAKSWKGGLFSKLFGKYN